MTGTAQAADLVADIGGTNVRFGLATRSGRVERVQKYLCADHPSPAAAVRAYLAASGAEPPRRAAFAIASPVRGDRIKMTNHVWDFSIDALRRELDLERLVVLNDYTALALAIPALADGDTLELRPGRPESGSPVALLGPGTGLGVAALVPAGDAWTALATEGGHRDLAAQSEREWQVVRHLRERFEHVSAERVLSGPGLVNLYEALCRLADTEPQSLTPAAVEAGARERSSAACIEALALFSGWLGAVAGDLALTLGARGGVYLGGDMMGKLRGVFDVDRFCERFLGKGRFREYLRPIPVRVIVRPHAALLGAAQALPEADGPADR